MSRPRGRMDNVLDPRFVFLAAAFSLFGSGRYVVQTLRGEAQPNRVTWFLWAAAPIIGFFAQLDDGVGLPSVMTLSVGLGPAAIFAASFFAGAGYWRITAFDIACGVVSLAALVLWLTLDDPSVAIVFAVLADFMGAVPTIRKAWTDPATERPGVFALSGVNGLITTLTLDRWDLATALFPVYIVGIAFGIAALIAVRSRMHVTRPAVVGGAR